MKCGLCPHGCEIAEGKYGFCRARKNEGGKIICANYGHLTSLALDPIEKKPLAKFYPGSKILSAGSWGCNLRCPFCQNSDISTADFNTDTVYVSPRELIKKALELRARGNIGIAFTYNEPLISYEYIMDCAIPARREGLKIVLVTNGMINEEPLKDLLPHIDAMNIDLKGFIREFYDRVSGSFDAVKRSIELSVKSCHVEVTTLIIPGLNDGEDEIEAEAKWLASLGRDIPLHISRFFPRYKMTDRPPAPVEKIYRLRDIAARHLSFVYTGNC